MERAGIAVDVDALEELRKQAQAATDEAESEARNLVDKPELNLGSPKQLQEVLFDQLGMPKTKKTKKTRRTCRKKIQCFTLRLRMALSALNISMLMLLLPLPCKNKRASLSWNKFVKSALKTQRKGKM